MLAEFKEPWPEYLSTIALTRIRAWITREVALQAEPRGFLLGFYMRGLCPAVVALLGSLLERQNLWPTPDA